MGREKDIRDAAGYLYSWLDDEGIQKKIREKNADIRSIADPSYQLETFNNSGVPKFNARREIPVPFPAMLAPKISRDQARDNIAAFNRGVDALPRVARDYVAETTPRQMLSDGRSMIAATAQGIVNDPVGTMLDMTPIVGTYRAYAESDRLNKSASDARARGDAKAAEKLEAFAALNTVSGTFSGLPVAAGLRWLNRRYPAGEPEIPWHLRKNPEPDQNTVQRALSQGFNQKQANNLGLPYEGEGSHFISQKWLRDMGVPDWIIDSRFNLIDGTGMSKGDFYEFHHMSDPDFEGTSLPWKSEVGGGRWSGKKIGLKRYGPVGRLWHRSPTPLKFAVGTPLAVGGLLYWSDKEED